MLTKRQKDFIKELVKYDTVKEACEARGERVHKGYLLLERVREKRKKFRDDENFILAKERENPILKRLLLPISPPHSKASVQPAEPTSSEQQG